MRREAGDSFRCAPAASLVEASFVGGVRRCRLCGGETRFALRAHDRARPEAQGHDYEYVECTACGTLQLASEVEDLAGADAPTYYTRLQRLPRVRPGGWLGWRRLRSRLVLRLATWSVGRGLARLLAGRRYGRFAWLTHTATGLDDAILDVGCGSGRLLFRMAGDGFRRLAGLDPALPDATLAAAAGRAELRLARAAPTTHEPDARGAYHLVMAHHSFEHMTSPREAFAAMAALVAPGGWLLLRVPLADSWACRHYGADWAQLDAPRHRQIPTRRAIEALAREHGFAVDRVVDDSGPFQIVGSEPRARFPALAALVARRRARALRRAHRGDQAAFYLRRLP